MWRGMEGGENEGVLIGGCMNRLEDGQAGYCDTIGGSPTYIYVYIVS